MQIRELEPADATASQALRREGLRECPSAFASSDEEEYQTPLTRVAERLAPLPNRCVLGAFANEQNEQLVGIVGIERETMQKLSHKAGLWGVYVAPSARQTGVGRTLITATLARAAAMPGVRQVNLSVNAANTPAIALYTAAGFVSFGLEHCFLLLDGELHDEIHMVHVLKGAQSKQGSKSGYVPNLQHTPD